MTSDIQLLDDIISLIARKLRMIPDSNDGSVLSIDIDSRSVELYTQYIDALRCIDDAGDHRLEFRSENSLLSIGGRTSTGQLFLYGFSDEQDISLNVLQPTSSSWNAIDIRGHPAILSIGTSGNSGSLYVRNSTQKSIFSVRAENLEARMDGILTVTDEVRVKNSISSQKVTIVDGEGQSLFSLDSSKTLSLEKVTASFVEYITRIGATLEGDGADSQSYATAHAIQIRDTFPRDNSYEEFGRIFIGDSRYHNEGRFYSSIEEIPHSVHMNTDGQLFLGGIGRSGSITIRDPDGSPTLELGIDEINLYEVFSVRPGDGVQVHGAQPVRLTYAGNDRGTVIHPGGISLEGNPDRTDSSTKITLWEGAERTIELLGSTGTVRTKDVELPDIPSLLTEIKTLKERIASLEAKDL